MYGLTILRATLSCYEWESVTQETAEAQPGGCAGRLKNISAEAETVQLAE